METQITKPTTGVYIGRFAPLHNGHEGVIKRMLSEYTTVIVLIGSANRRRNLKNPYETDTIESWIQAIDPTIKVATINDYSYDETKWITQVETIVGALSQGDVTLVGHTRDSSSFYLKEFPNWRYEEVEALAGDICGTEIRDLYFTLSAINKSNVKNVFKDSVPEMVLSSLQTFVYTQAYADMIEEREYHEAEMEKFKDYPYKETLKLCCADMVLVCSGNILLIERKYAPGKGTWALAGGFVNANETFKDCAVRELKEETGVKVSSKVIKGSIKAYKTFDNPSRNMGIPRMTNAYYAEIDPDYVGDEGYPKLPKVKGSDDAMNASWVPLANIKNMKLFDDHADIIDYFTKSL